MNRVLGVALIALAVMAPRPAQAEPIREFVLSCSYGVLAGTLVGAATLAFVDKPGDNLNRVARGASIGLYSGMLLGLYVIYGVPSDDDDDDDMPVAFIPGSDAGMISGDDASGASRVLVARSERAKVRLIEPPRLQLLPLVTERGLEGASAQVSILRF